MVPPQFTAFAASGVLTDPQRDIGRTRLSLLSVQEAARNGIPHQSVSLPRSIRQLSERSVPGVLGFVIAFIYLGLSLALKSDKVNKNFAKTEISCKDFFSAL